MFWDGCLAKNFDGKQHADLISRSPMLLARIFYVIGAAIQLTGLGEGALE